LVLPARVVELYGTEIPIKGVDVDYIGTLWDRFPQLSEAAASGNITPRAILALGPDVAGAFIAAGTGAGGDAKAEAVARALPLGDKLALMGHILEMTMPRGPGPFVEDFVRIMSALGMISPTPASDGSAESSGK
jgi:hypothetical protein